MGDKTGISWTDATWNPVPGCSRVSEGCRHCYAEVQAARIVRMARGKPSRYDGLVRVTAGGEARWTGKVVLDPQALALPLSWRKPRRIFVNSMGDLFHESLTNDQIAAVFGVMAAAPQHTFQCLTKRPARMREWFEWIAGGHDSETNLCAQHADLALTDAGLQMWSGPRRAVMRGEAPWPLPNVWLGVSIENQAAADERIPELLRTPAAVRFLSCEPLLGKVDLSRWLGGNDVEQDQEGRGIRLRGGEGGRIADPSERRDLARGEANRRPSWSAVGSVQSDASDEAVRQRVAALQRPDPGRADGEPQERDQARQQAGEPRACDGLRAAATRDPRAPQGAGSEPEWHQESRREADDGASRRDSCSEGTRREADSDREAVRGDLSARLGRRARAESIGWLVCGCESGPGARPCSVEWLRSLRDQCAAAGVPFFLKQARQLPYIEGVGIDPSDPIACGPGSRRKHHGVIELPYLDGVQHAAFPEVQR